MLVAKDCSNITVLKIGEQLEKEIHELVVFYLTFGYTDKKDKAKKLAIADLQERYNAILI